jgi:hypothetical protein
LTWRVYCDSGRWSEKPVLRGDTSGGFWAEKIQKVDHFFLKPKTKKQNLRMIPKSYTLNPKGPEPNFLRTK